MSTEELRTSSLTTHVFDWIKAMIMAGGLSPGERLPREHDLAVRLGISRSSLREAIRALTVLGVLDVRHGDGTYVTNLRAAEMLDGFRLVVEVSQGESALDLLAVRRILEPTAASIAAARMDDRQLAELAEALAGMREGPSVEDKASADQEFHRIVVSAAGNPALSAIVDGLSSRTVRARMWRSQVDEGIFERTDGEHTAIYEALASRDPERARTAAAVHIERVEDWLRAALGARSPGASRQEAGLSSPF